MDGMMNWKEIEAYVDRVEGRDSEPDFIRHGWSFAQVPYEAVISPNLSGNDVRLFAYLIFRSGTKDLCWPGVERMTSDLGMSAISIKRSLKSLSDDNWIRRERRMGRSSLTHIFENQRECLEFDNSDKSASRITSDTTIVAPVRQENDTKINDNKYTAEAETDPLDNYAKVIEKKARKSKKADETLIHPAVAAYRQVVNLTPTIVQRKVIIEQVTDVERWKKDLEHWLFHDWMRANKAIPRMLDFHKTGGVLHCRSCDRNGNGAYKSKERLYAQSARVDSTDFGISVSKLESKELDASA